VKKPNPHLSDILHDIEKSDLTYREIARLYGLSPSRICHYSQRYGLADAHTKNTINRMSRKRLIRNLDNALEKINLYRRLLEPHERSADEELSEMYVVADHLAGRLKHLDLWRNNKPLTRF